ncbi:MAG: transcriptional regulator [Methanocellales archaeon]
MRERLFERVVNILNRAGFVTSERCDIRPSSFDLAARRGDQLLLLKVLSNIDGLSEEAALEIKKLAAYLLAHPLIVGERTSDHRLETGAVYLRYGIPAINCETLREYFIEEIPPLVYAAPGGLYVNIDGEELREVRMKKQLSLGDLASLMGVSRRTIRKYEEGMDATIDAAIKLEEILETPIAKPIDLLGFEVELERTPLESLNLSVLEKHVLEMLIEIGFDVLPTMRSPFDALSKDKSTTILTGISEHREISMKKVRLMSSISRVARAQSIYIVEKIGKSTQIGDTVLLHKDELKKIEDASEFVNLIEDKKHQARRRGIIT